MHKKRVVIICPGRGSYTRDTSNYLRDLCPEINKQLIGFDKKRVAENLPKISDLDKNNFRAKIHMTGENASPLIYTCSINDFMLIDKDRYDVVAVCGNSMGWYIALALGGVISYDRGYDLIQTMGTLTHNHGLGGQIIYPIIDDEWQIDYVKKEMILKEIENVKAYISIHLGGYIVIGGEQKSLDILLKKFDSYELIQKGSSIKLCLVACGSADIYLRLGPTSEWDIAAGHAILENAGGIITDHEGNEITYGKKDFKNTSIILKRGEKL